MKRAHIAVLVSLLAGSRLLLAEGEHAHPRPDQLGSVTFPTSCSASVQAPFEHALALLHSFAYDASEQAFRTVAAADPNCAIAHWGIAMSYFHQLWSPPDAEDLAKGWSELDRVQKVASGTARERAFIEAASMYFRDSEQRSASVRAKAYELSMSEVAAKFPDDVEAQIFHALALIATAPPTDRTHANQKRAGSILEPLYLRYPQHPGLAHYLIHAYDSADLAARGLAAARAYAKIAPSAPHALHMPSHIFTRLGYWDDSIASNRAARAAAHKAGDIGEELHAMDYLTYAYLQRGRNTDAERVVDDLHAMGDLSAAKFKIGYAANAMPVRLAIERQRWDVAAALEPLRHSETHVAAIVYWARAIGSARGGHPDAAGVDIAKIEACRDQLTAAGNTYWATQTDVLGESARAWQLQARGQGDAAIEQLRAAADQEDLLEKLPVTPGPIVPAREQLAQLLLALNRPKDALREFQAALIAAPGRRGAVTGGAKAAERAGNSRVAAQLRALLR